MNGVADDFADEIVVEHSRADHARLSVVKRRLRVERVGYIGRAELFGFFDLLESRVCMPDWEPKYDFDISFERPELEEHIEAGHISEDDVRDWVESCVEYEPRCEGAEIEYWDWDSYSVTNLTGEGYDLLDRQFYAWLDDWIEELNEEYPFEDRDGE